MMATRTSLKKSICILHSLWRLFLPTYFVNCRQTLLKLNFKRPYLSSEREIKFCCCLFTFSNERKIGHFHVVVVQKQERNVQKCDAHAKLLFCSLNLLFLWRFRCQPRRWILKSFNTGVNLWIECIFYSFVCTQSTILSHHAILVAAFNFWL